MSTTSNPKPEPPTYVFERADFDDHHFLFAFPNEKKRPSARQIQMQRLYDILNLCLHRDDLARARRAWSILARCKETNWKTMWTLGITLLANDVRVMESNLRKIDYLRTMLLQLPEERERILAELVQHYILAGRHRDALDELEFYLPSFPYHDNPVLHVYAGFLCVFIAQPPEPIGGNDIEGAMYDSNLLSRAQIFLERAKELDPDNIVASEFLHKLHSISQGPSLRSFANHDSEDETHSTGYQPPHPKRMRSDA